MTLSTAQFQSAAVRHAAYYLTVLDDTTALHNMMDTQTWPRFDAAWAQINHSFQFLVEYSAQDDTAATLCINFTLKGYQLLFAYRELALLTNWLETALEIATRRNDAAAIVDVRLRLAALYIAHTTVTESRAQAETALELAEAYNYAVGKAKALLELGRICIPERKTEEATRLLTQAAEQALALNLLETYGWALHNLSAVQMQLNQYAEAEQSLRRAIDAYEQVGARRLMAMSLSRLGETLELEGDAVTGLQYAEDALEMLRLSGDIPRIASCLLRAGIIAFTGGHKDKYRLYCEEAAELCRQAQLDATYAVALENLAWIAFEDGDLGLLEDYSLEALEIFRRMENPGRVALALSSLSLPYVLQGRFEEALATIQEAWVLSRQLDDANATGQTIFHHAILLVYTDRSAPALQLYGIIMHHYPHAVYPEQIDLLRARLEESFSTQALEEVVTQAANLSTSAIITLVEALLG
jgi:tetratricopeptide (TPR) repeat protein